MCVMGAAGLMRWTDSVTSCCSQKLHMPVSMGWDGSVLGDGVFILSVDCVVQVISVSRTYCRGCIFLRIAQGVRIVER